MLASFLKVWGQCYVSWTEHCQDSYDNNYKEKKVRYNLFAYVTHVVNYTCACLLLGNEC